MAGIQKALGTFHLVELPILRKLMTHVSYVTRDGRWDKQDAE